MSSALQLRSLTAKAWAGGNRKTRLTGANSVWEKLGEASNNKRAMPKGEKLTRLRNAAKDIVDKGWHVVELPARYAQALSTQRRYREANGGGFSADVDADAGFREHERRSFVAVLQTADNGGVLSPDDRRRGEWLRWRRLDSLRTASGDDGPSADVMKMMIDLAERACLRH